MQKDSLIYVAGSTGLAGSAIVRRLCQLGHNNLLLSRIDCACEQDVFDFFYQNKPEYVIVAAAHAGGINEAITNPVGMLSDNLSIQGNLIRAAHKFKTKRLLFLGSSCIYPINAKQPFKEEQVGTGKTDENWSYAVAKLAGIELCRAYHRQFGCDFVTVIPCNLYGINDNFSENKSHVIPALIKKIHEAEGGFYVVWGSSGKTQREFLYADDFAKAVVFLMSCDYNCFFDGCINVGSGESVSINELCDIIQNVVNRNPRRIYDPDKPSGVFSKLMDSSRINALGWRPCVSLVEGIEKTYEAFKNSTYCKSG